MLLWKGYPISSSALWEETTSPDMLAPASPPHSPFCFFCFVAIRLPAWREGGAKWRWSGGGEKAWGGAGAGGQRRFSFASGAVTLPVAWFYLRSLPLCLLLLFAYPRKTGRKGHWVYTFDTVFVPDQKAHTLSLLEIKRSYLMENAFNTKRNFKNMKHVFW